MKVEKSDLWRNSLDLNHESRTRNNDVNYGKAKPDTAAARIHDGLKMYDGEFQKEYFKLKNPRVKNIHSISVRNQVQTRLLVCRSHLSRQPTPDHGAPL
jgi:hypothetical protein